jgi:Beta protein
MSRAHQPLRKEKKLPKITQKAERAARALVDVPHPGLAFSHKHHVFIAKVKRGELWAVNYLSVAARAAITPLFEMWPPPNPRKPKPGVAPKKPTAAKSVAAHATSLLQTIRDEWGTLPFFLDTQYVPLGGIPSPASARIIFDVARAMHLSAVPVTSIRFAPAYQQEIRNVIANDRRGAMIRLLITDFINSTLLGQYLDGLLAVLQINASEVDILIDLEFRREQVEVKQLGGSAVSVLPNLGRWRTVTLASGSFPSSISNLPYKLWMPVPRADWLGWLDVHSAQVKAAGRIPSYGDYGIRCGGPPTNIPNRPDPNIRYTSDKAILVRRGPKTDGAMKAICADLVTKTEFSGSAFSRGDAEIAARATMQGSPNNGQAEQWIQWCTNHHLELTASQIRTLP